MNEPVSKSKTSIRIPLFVGPLVALILIIALFAVLDNQLSQGQFFTFDNLTGITIQSCVVGIAAVGMTLVIISGGIDLSCGTAVALSATVAAWCVYQDIGCRVQHGSNTRDAAINVAQLIKELAEAELSDESDSQAQMAVHAEALEKAKKRLSALLEIKLNRLRVSLTECNSRIDEKGWGNLSPDEVQELKDRNYWEHDRYERVIKDYDRITTNITTVEDRLESLPDDDFFLSIDAATKDWGNNVPNHPMTIYISVLGGVLTGLGCGLVNGMLVAYLKIVPFVVTLGTMTIFLGIGNLISGNVPIRTVQDDQLPSWIAQSLSLNSEYLFLGLPPGIWILVMSAATISIVLWATVFGRYAFALGSSEPTARLCGIDVAWQKLLIYALSGALIGLAGVFYFSRLTMADPESGLGMELKVIAAVVIGGGSLTGGRGSVVGTLCGAVMLTVILNGCTQLGLPVSIEKIVIGCIIIFAVYLDQPAVKAWLRRRLGKSD